MVVPIGDGLGFALERWLAGRLDSKAIDGPFLPTTTDWGQRDPPSIGAIIREGN
jgi:hypothetical protein